MRDFGDDVFAQAAYYYAKYRPAYPKKMFDDIADFFNLDGHGRLMDLGCGTGEMGIPLAHHFEQVLAIDPDSQMLKYGQQKAAKRQISNIIWQKGSSRSLTEVDGYFKLITMGQSFHWMDARSVINRLHQLLEKNGGVVIVGGGGDSVRKSPRVIQKDEIVKRLVAKYLGPKRRAGNKFYTQSEFDFEKDIFSKPPFGNFRKHYYAVQVHKNVDQIVGHLYSMSWAVKGLFGKQILVFDAEIKNELYQALGTELLTENYRLNVHYLVKK